MSTITPYMSLTLPDVGITLGPEWAQEIKDALTDVDAHTHQPGSGKLINTAAIEIDADLSFNGSNGAYALRSLSFTNQGAAIFTPGSIYEYGGNFYFTNSGGTPIQITNGSSIISAAVYLINSSVNSNVVVSAADTFTFLLVNTSEARTITLPAANTVTAGRFYYIKDITGGAEANNITIIRNGTDTFDGVNANRVLSAAYQSVKVTSNGVNGWALEFHATENILKGIFGTASTNTQFIGNTVSIAAQSSNAVTIGNTNNDINIEGDTFAWQAHTYASFTFGGNFDIQVAGDLSITAPGSHNLATGNWVFGGSGETFRIVGPMTAADTSHLIGNITSDGTNDWNGENKFHGQLRAFDFFEANTNASIGTNSSNALTVYSTATFHAPVTMNGNVTLGSDASDLLTVNAVSVFNTSITVGAHVHVKSFEVDDNCSFGSSSSDTVTIFGTTTVNSPIGIDAALTVSASSTLNGTATFSNTATFSGDQIFNGPSTFNGDITINSPVSLVGVITTFAPGYFYGRLRRRMTYTASGSSSAYSPAAGYDVIYFNSGGASDWVITIPVAGAVDGDVITFVNAIVGCVGKITLTSGGSGTPPVYTNPIDTYTAASAIYNGTTNQWVPFGVYAVAA